MNVTMSVNYLIMKFIFIAARSQLKVIVGTLTIDLNAPVPIPKSLENPSQRINNSLSKYSKETQHVKNMRKETKKKRKKEKKQKFDFNNFIGKQLARLRFGVTYVQMLYYAAVILGAIVLIIDNIFGEGIIGWLDSIAILLVIFVFEWIIGFYTEKTGIVKKDRTLGSLQNIPAAKIVQKEVSKEVYREVIIPQMEEMFERVLTKTLGNLSIFNYENMIKEVKRSITEEKKK